MNNKKILVVSIALWTLGSIELSLFAQEHTSQPYRTQKSVKNSTKKKSKTLSAFSLARKEKRAAQKEQQKSTPLAASAQPLSGKAPEKKKVYSLTIPTSTDVPATAVVLDEITTIVVGDAGQQVITASDQSMKKNLQGQLLTDSELIEKAMIMLDSMAKLEKYIDPYSGEKYLNSIRQKNNLNFEDLQQMATDLGLTYFELKQLLQYEYIREMWLNYNFKTNIVVTDDQVEEYVQKHPEYHDATIQVELANCSYDSASKKEMQIQLDNLVYHTPASIKLSFAEPIVVRKKEVADDKAYLFDAKVGQYLYTDNGTDEFEVYHVVDKTEPKLKTIDERRSSVIALLQHEAYVQKYLEQQTKLQQNFVVVHLT